MPVMSGQSEAEMLVIRKGLNMWLTAVVAVTLACVCVAQEAPIGEQLGPQLSCPAPKHTSVKVVLRTQQNATGHWVSRVAVKQRMWTSEGSESDHWRVDVEQNTDTCESDDESVLETVFYLSAPPSSRGSPSPRTPHSEQDSHLAQWVCPSCAACPPCGDAQTQTQTETASVPRGSVPQGYNRFVGVGLYKFHTEAQTWTDARDTCEGEGGHLAIMNSDQEAEAMMTLISSYPSAKGAKNNAYIHVGAQRIGKDYVTVEGEELVKTGFVRWGPGEPSGGNEFCLSLIRNKGLFNDVPCSWKLGFICEHPSSE